MHGVRNNASCSLVLLMQRLRTLDISLLRYKISPLQVHQKQYIFLNLRNTTNVILILICYLLCSKHVSFPTFSAMTTNPKKRNVF